MSRHPSRSLVSIVATGSDNQRGFCHGLKVCLLALPRVIRHPLGLSSLSLSTTTPYLAWIFPRSNIRVLSSCLRLHVCEDSTRIPSASNTTSFARPPSSKWSLVVSAESLCSKIIVRPFAKGSSSWDKAIKCTLRLPPQRDSRLFSQEMFSVVQGNSTLNRRGFFGKLENFTVQTFFHSFKFPTLIYKFTPFDIRVNNGLVADTGELTSTDLEDVKI